MCNRSIVSDPGHILHHPALKELECVTDLSHTCGYVAMLNTGAPPTQGMLTPKSRKRIIDQKGI